MFLFVKEQCTLTDMSIHHVNVTSAGPARSMVREEQKYTYLNKQWICLGKAESKFVCFNGTLFSISQWQSIDCDTGEMNVYSRN